MAAINIGKDEYADIVIAFLLDNLMNEEVIPNNERFDAVMDIMKKGGMKSHFLHYYLNTDPMVRGRYKLIKPAFTNKASGNYTINIKKDKSIKSSDKKKSDSLTKTVVKKALRLIKSHKKRYGNLITEDVIDRLVEKAIEEI